MNSQRQRGGIVILYAFALCVILSVVIGFMSKRVIISFFVSADSYFEKQAYWNAQAGKSIASRGGPVDDTSIAYSGGSITLNAGSSLGGIQAWYPLRDDANDNSGNGNHGTVTGARSTTDQEPDRFGNPNSAYSFDGVDDRIIIAESPTLKPTQAITISAWVYPEEIAPAAWSNAIVTKGGNTSDTDSYWLGFKNGSFNFITVSGQSNANLHETTTSTSYDGQDDRWYHVVATFDKPDKTIYVNGVEKASGSWNYDIGYVESPHVIGAEIESGSYKYFFNGLIDDVYIYDRALSPEEILTLFNDGLVDGRINDVFKKVPYTLGAGIEDIPIPGDDTPTGPEMTMLFKGNPPSVASRKTIPNNIALAPELSMGTDFDEVIINIPIERIFTIVNSGSGPLNLSGSPRVRVTGDAAEFTVSEPPLTIDAYQIGDFVVTFLSSDVGVKTATLSIENSDADENPYQFQVTAEAKPDAIEFRYIKRSIQGRNWSTFEEFEAFLDGTRLSLSVASVSNVYRRSATKWSAVATVDGKTNTCYCTSSSRTTSANIVYDLSSVREVSRLLMDNQHRCSYGPVTHRKVEYGNSPTGPWTLVSDMSSIGSEIEAFTIE